MGCQNKPVGPVTPFTPAAIDPQAFSKKVDTFVIVMDASETMGDMYQGRRKADIAKDIVAHMNQTIPPYDYRAGLVAFGSGSCLDSKDAKVLYGMTTYRRADLASGLETLKCVGGISPMSEGIAAGHASPADGRFRPDRADHHQRRRRDLRHRGRGKREEAQDPHGRQAVHLPHPGGR